MENPPLTEQYKFIRRAELMVALLMQSERNEVLQITGSSFAANMINVNTGKSFDLDILLCLFVILP